MSEALARMASGTAYVMTTDVNNIPTGGIWHEIERRTLQRTIRGTPVGDEGKCNRV
jgi:hypothetical protein